MSEPKPEYITDALEMIGISEPKQIITEVSGFVPIFEVVLSHYEDLITASVFGRMWQYCNMSDGVCRASLERIGNDLKISSATVMRHAEKLVNDGFLIDTTPDRRNAPHEYLDGRRVEMKGRISAGIAERKPTVSQRNATVSESQLIKQDNTILNNNSDSSNSKPAKVVGIEASIFEGRKTTDEDIDPAKTEHAAIIAFEASFGVNTEKGQMLVWYGRKPEWTKLRKDVVELYQADSQCFEKYKIWRLTPYSKGTVSLKDVQRDPKCFMASWIAFVEATSYGNSETNNTYTDEKGLPLT